LLKPADTGDETWGRRGKPWRSSLRRELLLPY
jgi:hypothetical protein